tara:strand:+ start:245 stop:904 length:660 start_codon:yes stop_codon:yes gene_type:complete
MNHRQIVKELRLKLREYFPDLQLMIDDWTITKNDWKYFGMIQFNLIKCFTITPEKAIRDSKTQLNKIVKFYQLESRVRKNSLKSELFISENSIDPKSLAERFQYFQDIFDYWSSRKRSNKRYMNYEVFLFLYYKWMNNYEFDKENSFKLILDLMELSNYYAYRYNDIDKLKSERLSLLEHMKISSHVLPLIDQTINQQNIRNNKTDMDVLLKEANEHLN